MQRLADADPAIVSPSEHEANLARAQDYIQNQIEILELNKRRLLKARKPAGGNLYLAARMARDIEALQSILKNT